MPSALFHPLPNRAKSATKRLEASSLPIRSVRSLRKTDMVRNAALPRIEVDPQTFEVRADGELLTCAPAARVPLNRRYLLR